MARKAEVIFVGDAASVVRAAQQAEGAVSKSASGISKSHSSISSSFSRVAKSAVGAGIGFAGAFASFSAAKGAISVTEDLARTTLGLHKNLGLTIEKASEWAAVAKARGIDTRQLNQAFGTLSKNAEAVGVASEKQATKLNLLGNSAKDNTAKQKLLSAGLGSQSEMFKKLGLSTQDVLKGKTDFNTFLGKVADGFAKLPPGAEKAAIGMKLFGRGWQTILPVIRDGSKSMNEQLALADKYGVTFKGKTVKSLMDLVAAQRESKFATLGLQVAFGTMLAPALTKAITAVNGFVVGIRNGTGAGGQFRDTVVHVFNDVKNVAVPVFNAVKDVVVAAFGVIKDVAPTVASALKTVVGALGGVKTILPAVVAGFAAFKIAATLIPILAGLARVITAVKTAGAAATFGQMAGNVAAMVNPVTAVAVGIGALAGVFLLMKNREKSEADAAKDVANAKRDEADAIRGAQDAALGAADAQFNAIHADKDYKDAVVNATAALVAYGPNSKQYQAALRAEHEASLHNVEAQHQVASANAATTKSNNDAAASARRRMAADQAQAQAAIRSGLAEVQASGGNIGLQQTQGYQRAKAALMDYIRAQQQLTGVQSTVALQQFQLQRLMEGGDLITTKNAGSVANLIAAYKRVPPNVQTKISALPQQALSTIGDLIGRLKGVASLQTITKILANSQNAQDTINSLKGLLNTLPGAAVSAGQALGQGLASGIQSTIAGVEQQAASLVSGAIAAAKAAGGIHSPSTVFAEIGRNLTEGLIQGAKSGSARAAAAILYPIEAAITAANAAKATLQAGFDKGSADRQWKALVGQLNAARGALGYDYAHDRKSIGQGQKNLAAAKAAMADFKRNAAQAAALAKFDLQISGLEKLKAFNDAIAQIRTQMHDLATQAIGTWKTNQQAFFNSVHDNAVKAAQAIHDASMAAIESGSQAGELAGLTATDKAETDAKTREANQKALDDANKAVTDAQFLVAHSAGQTHKDALAQLADAQEKVKDALSTIAAYDRQVREGVLQGEIDAAKAGADAKLTADTKAADDALEYNLHTSEKSVDALAAQYQTSLDNQLTALTNNLNARTITYVAWAKGVNDALAPYGLSAPVDSSTEGAITAVGPPPSTKPPPKKPPKKPPPHRHRQMGGSVLPGEVYTVGETGPEDFVPDRRGTIMTAPQTRARHGHGGPTVHIEHASFTGTRAARAFADRLAYKARIGVA